MCTCLQFALMAIPITATFLFLSPQLDSSHNPITVNADGSAHCVRVNENDLLAAALNQTCHSEGKRLVYGSKTKHGSKAVRPAHVQAARTGAAKMDLEKPPSGQNSSPASGFTQREIDTAVDTAARGDIVTPKPVGALAKMESNLNLMAGRKGAVGLMQLMRPDPGN